MTDRRLYCGMEAKIIPCEATLADGAICDQLAILHETTNEYASKLDWEHGGTVRRVLLETRYDIECPRCGRLTKVQRHDAT
jgi:hypothetical protein